MYNLEITSRCIGCDNCRAICPEGSVLFDGKSYSIETSTCTICNYCLAICPVECIKIIESN